MISRRVFAAGALACVLLCILAVVYFKERMVLPDDANYIFDLVNNGGRFAIFHHRFIAAAAQVLPFFAIRAGMGLASVTLLYSLNIALYYGLCYLACGLLLRDYRAAIAMLLSCLLFTTHTFYWTVSELGLSIALLFVLIAVIASEKIGGVLRTVVIAGLLFTIACGHALAAFALAFVLCFFWLSWPQARRRLVMCACLFAAALICKRLLLYDAYDSHALGGLRNFYRLFPDYFSTESMRRFAANCLGPYCWIPIILLLNAIYYIRERNWLKLALMCGFSFGYLLLTTVAFPDVAGKDFYNENLYLPAGVFLCVPLVYDVLPGTGKPAFSFGLIAVVLACGILRIWYYHRPYTARLGWQRGVIRQYEGRKVILDEKQFPKDTLLMSWSSPYEFWLLSTIEKGATSSILITAQPERYAAAAGGDPRIFVPAFDMFRYRDLSPKYFVFRDTVHPYEWVR